MQRQAPKSLSLSQLPHSMEETVKVSWTIFSFSSHPLFSILITLYSLILIYFPHDLLRIFLSPVLLISASLLFSLLRLGSTRDSNTRPGKIVNTEETKESNVLVRDSLSEAKRDLMGDFMEWNLRAPLEVIHEAYEEEDDDDDEVTPTRWREIERFPSLSLCYPESDSESDSGSSSEFNFLEISPEKMGFRWEEEEDGIGGEELIEIKLDEYNRSHNKKMNKRNQTELDFHAEEDGLIEIDLFP